MENDLISRSALWTDIMMLPHNGDIISSEEVEQTIVEAPAVDAVSFDAHEGKMVRAMLYKQDGVVVEFLPVVRCKDCKHYMTIHCTCDGCCISDYWFCADGERRTNDGN